jgi:hypothetical protein
MEEILMPIMSIKNGNIVDAIVNAIVGGFRDDLILEELAQALENEDITTDQFKSASEGLKLYVTRFADSVKAVSDAMNQFEFNDKQSIIKNRPMNLAQQVMQDVGGFSDAAKEYYQEEGDEDKSEQNAQDKAQQAQGAGVEQKADIKKPNPEATKPQPEKKPEQKLPIKKTDEEDKKKAPLPPQRNK